MILGAWLGNLLMRTAVQPVLQSGEAYRGWGMSLRAKGILNLYDVLKKKHCLKLDLEAWSTGRQLNGNEVGCKKYSWVV